MAHSKSLDSKQQSLLTFLMQDPGTTNSVPKCAVLPLKWQRSLYMFVQCLSSHETICSQEWEPCLYCGKSSFQHLACPFSKPDIMFYGPAAPSYKSSTLKEGLTEVFVCVCTHTHTQAYPHAHAHIRILGKISLKFYLVVTNLLAIEIGSLSMALGHQRTKATWLEQEDSKIPSSI